MKSLNSEMNEFKITLVLIINVLKNNAKSITPFLTRTHQQIR